MSDDRRCDACGERARGRKAGAEAAEKRGTSPQLTLGALAARSDRGYICPACDTAARFPPGVVLGGYVSVQCRIGGISAVVIDGRAVPGSGRAGYKGRYCGRLRVQPTTQKRVRAGDLVDVIEGAAATVARVVRLEAGQRATVDLVDRNGRAYGDPRSVRLARVRPRRRWYVETDNGDRIEINVGEVPRCWRFTSTRPVDPTVPIGAKTTTAAQLRAVEAERDHLADEVERLRVEVDRASVGRERAFAAGYMGGMQAGPGVGFGVYLDGWIGLGCPDVRHHARVPDDVPAEPDEVERERALAADSRFPCLLHMGGCDLPAEPDDEVPADPMLPGIGADR